MGPERRDTKDSACKPRSGWATGSLESQLSTVESSEELGGRAAGGLGQASAVVVDRDALEPGPDCSEGQGASWPFPSKGQCLSGRLGPRPRAPPSSHVSPWTCSS